ncbi:MAG: DUF1318 domain-containing protein [Candidatus Omnitrophota bacterium]|nr:YdbL family protein [Candidatus Omnitrophota bacterium]MBU1928922.1 YdbL family protein [Candidatus Omnitrophota bacterium]MBU2035353.1 YdbL family protein [Candidatus Omnitrophota bacterium]MBU2221407.1 YdbL family protein [Candidatus Omnitrophota bacterium]MBU2258751.1 YdbL family protein [Candidatus Omnitrophota bacterium]
MKRLFLISAFVILAVGCARLSVQGSKEPIKVDISMRLDVYQHVEKDIAAIESLVSGAKDIAKPGDKQSFLINFIPNAYAQEGFSPEVEQAALRRKERINELYALEGRGVVGENKSGLVEARDLPQVSTAVKQIIDAENSDRIIIYKAVAAKNNTSLEDVQKLYAKHLQSDAPSGTPVEVLNEGSGAYGWRLK